MTEQLPPELIAALKKATPEEVEFWLMYSRAYLGGKRFACYAARGLVALGMVLGAVAGIIAFVSAVSGFRPHV